MGPDRASLEDLIGFLGVGALELLGLFLILDGISGLRENLDSYAGTSTWTILVTAPALVVSYILGLVSSLAVESALHLPPILAPESFAQATGSGNDALIRRYAEVERHTRLLNGCLVAFVLVGFGSLAQVRTMGHFGFVGYLGLCVALFAAILCPLVARYQQRKLLPYIHAVCNEK